MICCLLALVTGAMLLSTLWQPEYAQNWLVMAGAAAIYMLIVLGRNLPHNYRQEQAQLLPTLGVGNTLTLLRGILLALSAGFLFSPWPPGQLAWLPAAIFTLATALDYFDGFLARLTNQATRLGEILDMNFDGLAVMVGSLLAFQYGQVPWWYLLVAFARYLFVGGLWLRRRMGLPVYELNPSIRRRAFAALQMGFIAAMIWPVFGPPATHLAAAVFALPFLAGFAWDWFQVSGALSAYNSKKQRVLSEVARWAPPAIRVTIGLIFLSLLIQGLVSSSFSPYLEILLTLAMLFMLLGAAGRVAALAGMLLLGILQTNVHFEPGHYLLVTAFTALLYLGSGPYSLWKPEDALIYRRAGERLPEPLAGLEKNGAGDNYLMEPEAVNSRMPIRPALAQVPVQEQQ
jgi:CDP-diacylglycerol--glycerol-3-phosphate 3-phosphatidyltransferase